MTPRVRILTIGHSYTIAMNRALIREIAKFPEFDVTVAAPDRFHGDLRPLVIDAEPVGSLVALRSLHARWTKHIHVFQYEATALRELMRKRPFDIVHAWEEPYIYAGYQIAKAVEPTASRFCFRTAQSYVKWYPPPFSYFEKRVVARAQGWIAGASLVHKAMLARGYPSNRGRILNLAVDLRNFSPLDAYKKAEIRSKLGLTKPVVGFVGRLTAAKGLDVLMQAMERLPAAQPWSLLLLGSGEYEKKISLWARQHGWNDRVVIRLVRHDEAPRYIGAMDLLVAPSQTMPNWREQFGRMLIEAFACGVPVVGSDSGEIPAVIGDAGQVVPEADIDGWARTIQELLENPGAREEMRQRGLERVQRFSAASIADQYRDFYLWLQQQ
jgi:glycosyltransferase involved in cell wall biosynthesis